jgi:zinc transport system substrate-binding protein
MLRIRLIIVIGIAVAAVVSLMASSSAAAPRQVVASFYPLAYAAQQIGAGTVTVDNLTPVGAEPHDLELKVSDVRAIQDADLVLFFGRGFQPGVERAVRSTSANAIDLLDGLSLRHGKDEDGHPAADPHVWLDPLRYSRIGERIGAALNRRHAAATFASRLRKLDADYRAGLANCKRRTIITSHAAFGYLAQRYRLTQLAIDGLSPESEPTPRGLARLVEQVKRTGATTVFFETLVSPKVANTVAREAGVATAVLDPIEGLTRTSQAARANYFTIMRSNLKTLRKALDCR